MSEYTQRIEVLGPCLTGDCDCIQRVGIDPDKAGYPPYHDGCTCVVTRVEVGMSEQTALAPCPFCGSTDVFLYYTGWHFGACKSCESQGPKRMNRADAAQAWNDRAAVQAEREACAQVAESSRACGGCETSGYGNCDAGENIAEAIRARADGERGIAWYTEQK